MAEPQDRNPRRQRRGVAIVYTTLTLLVFLPMVGLAIDGAILYFLKLRLQQAVDAGVLAGARSLSRGEDIASQAANAEAIANMFFDANFPEGFWGTTNLTRTPVVTETDTRLRRVHMTASVDAPLYFMRVLGHEFAHLEVVAEAHRRDVNIMMVLDRSGSMDQAQACDDLRDAATSFANKFSVGRDRLGLITFNGAYSLDFAPSFDFQPGIVEQISQIDCGGWTGMSQALWKGYEELVNINDQGALNVILFFTDGRPTALTASWEVKKLEDERLYYNYPYQPEVRMDPSECRDGSGLTWRNAAWWPLPKVGFIAAGRYRGDPFNPYGPTYGIYRHDVKATEPTPINFVDSLGCYFASNARYVRRDIAYIPETDLYGNSTDNGYKPVPRYPAGPYAGKIRVDSPQALRYAAYNATDDAAYRIRNDAALRPVIYVIGLGGVLNAEPPDHELMRRMANDPASPVYDRSKPAGLYVYAPGPEQLNEAFLRVASEILRLAL